MWVMGLRKFGTEPGPKSEVRSAVYCEAVVPRGGGWGARSRSSRVWVGAVVEPELPVMQSEAHQLVSE